MTKPPPHLLEVDRVERRFGKKHALRGVSLQVRAGEIHALLGPNGAGKTTLLRILTGLVAPDSGRVSVAGLDPAESRRSLRRSVGLIPSGDRTFYLRLSGRENLAFFARLHGLRRSEAYERAEEVIAQVGLRDAARTRVGEYSHGMQKRLGVARALLTRPAVLLVDEATHDLDPEGSSRVRDLVAATTDHGTAVVWTTQKLDEIRGFAENVTLLSTGAVRFSGSVAELMSHSEPHRFRLRLRSASNGQGNKQPLAALVSQALGQRGRVEAREDSEHYLLALESGVILGDALASLAAARILVLTCTEEKSEIEQAFLALTDEVGA